MRWWIIITIACMGFSIGKSQEKPTFRFEGKICQVSQVKKASPTGFPVISRPTESGWGLLRIQGKVVPVGALDENGIWIREYHELVAAGSPKRYSPVQRTLPKASVKKRLHTGDEDLFIKRMLNLKLDHVYKVPIPWRGGSILVNDEALPLPRLSPPNSLKDLRPKPTVLKAYLTKEVPLEKDSEIDLKVVFGADERVRQRVELPQVIRPAHGALLVLELDETALTLWDHEEFLVQTKSGAYHGSFRGFKNGCYFTVPATTTRVILHAGDHKIPVVIQTK